MLILLIVAALIALAAGGAGLLGYELMRHMKIVLAVLLVGAIALLLWAGSSLQLSAAAAGPTDAAPTSSASAPFGGPWSAAKPASSMPVSDGSVEIGVQTMTGAWWLSCDHSADRQIWALLMLPWVVERVLM